MAVRTRKKVYPKPSSNRCLQKEGKMNARMRALLYGAKSYTTTLLDELSGLALLDELTNEELVEE